MSDGINDYDDLFFTCSLCDYQKITPLWTRKFMGLDLAFCIDCFKFIVRIDKQCIGIYR